MLKKKSTLTQFLIEERRSHPGAVGDLNSLIIDVALAVKQIGVASPALRSPTPTIDSRPMPPASCWPQPSGAARPQA